MADQKRMKVSTMGAVLLAVNSVLGADCGTSRQFMSDGSQRLAAILKDSSGSPLPGILMELLNGNTVVQQFRTDDDGKFDLALPSGQYRLRVVSHPFCAPKIDCQGDLCTVNGTVRINEKKAKPITVY
jgi:hypothetical protein